jgi:uroporphyrinogen-III synthase
MRVAVTRAEDDSGPLGSALRARGLVPVPCPLLVETALEDEAPLREAAARLDGYDWVIVASTRSVEALRAAREDPWPTGLRSAAVGASTARALSDAGATPPPVVAPTAGAAALWETLAPLDRWPDRRVLVLTTPGGRSTLIDAFRDAGARVDAIHAYRMMPRNADRIRADWQHGAPEAVVLTSPRATDALVDAVGRPALASLRAVIAIGETTARRLADLGVACEVAADTSFDAAAETLARRRAAAPGPRSSAGEDGR